MSALVSGPCWGAGGLSAQHCLHSTVATVAFCQVHAWLSAENCLLHPPLTAALNALCCCNRWVRPGAARRWVQGDWRGLGVGGEAGWGGGKEEVQGADVLPASAAIQLAK